MARFLYAELETERLRLRASAPQLLNFLIDRGIVSDQVIGLHDVAMADRIRAIAFLKQFPTPA